MKEIMVATSNLGKVNEFEAIFAPLGYVVKSLKDLETSVEIIEDGETFEENALIKARAIQSCYGGLVVADDSGLEVDALDKRPGVYSARYAGEPSNDENNMQKVLAELSAVKESERTARFVCALALVGPLGKEVVVRGTCEGRISFEKRGSQGFGYDPIFYVLAQAKTMAELSSAEKNKLSHRAEAMKQLKKRLLA